MQGEMSAFDNFCAIAGTAVLKAHNGRWLRAQMIPYCFWKGTNVVIVVGKIYAALHSNMLCITM